MKPLTPSSTFLFKNKSIFCISPCRFPYIMAWVSEVLTFVSAYLCFYTKCQEVALRKEMKKQKERHVLMRKISNARNKNKMFDQM